MDDLERIRRLAIGHGFVEDYRVAEAMRQVDAASAAYPAAMCRSSALDAILSETERQYESVRRAAGYDDSVACAAQAMGLDEAMLAKTAPWALPAYAQELGMSAAMGGTPDAITALIAETQARFRVPGIEEVQRLIYGISTSEAAFAVQTHVITNEAALRAMAGLHSPWLDANDAARSAHAMLSLHGIGGALNAFETFGDRLSASLRSELGDWRETIDWPSDIFTNPLVRSGFYAARGFDPALTCFPRPAFAEALGMADLVYDPPEPAERYLRPQVVVEVDHDPEEEGFERNNAAHDRLQRFESHLRRFIDERMCDAFGPNWPKHRVPEATLRTWIEKRQKARDRGEQESPLITYADFTDYVVVITRSDNWRELFQATFRRKTLVEESFQRLFPIRVCTMHSRIITPDDELYLLVETKRLLLAIGMDID